MKKQLLAVLLALFMVPFAHAFHCPADMRAIDEALADGPELSSEALERVQTLRAEGEDLHTAGKHQESVDVLAEAKQILGID